MKAWKRLLPLILALSLLAGLAGCGQSGGADAAPSESPEPDQTAGPGESPDLEEAYLEPVVMEDIDVADEAVALSEAPAALPTGLMPVASGTQVKQNERAIIDYSNTSDGYVMVKFTGTTATRIKVQVFGPSYSTKQLKYTYDLPVGAWTTYPLSDGNGEYKVTVLENTSGTKYAQVLSGSFRVSMADEFAPFLRPNQYVNYEVAPNTVAKAAELAGSETDMLVKVEKVYDFVVNNFTYDNQRAAAAAAGKINGYLPVLDSVLAEKKGICFDYASLMTGMLRSLGVPCKLVTGYVPTGGKQAYHAWISVWSQETGWVEGAIYFNGSAWQRMDPTFASSGKGSASIMQYIGNGSNYTVDKIY